MFATVELFQHGPLFGVRPGAHPRVEHQNNASLRQAQVLLQNIRLVWQDFLGKYTVAYYKNYWITAVKSFITLGPECYNTFTAVIYEFS